MSVDNHLKMERLKQLIDKEAADLSTAMDPSKELEAAQRLSAVVTEYVRMLHHSFPEHYEQWLRSVS